MRLSRAGTNTRDSCSGCYRGITKTNKNGVTGLAPSVPSGKPQLSDQLTSSAGPFPWVPHKEGRQRRQTFRQLPAAARTAKAAASYCATIKSQNERKRMRCNVGAKEMCKNEVCGYKCPCGGLGVALFFTRSSSAVPYWWHCAAAVALLLQLQMFVSTVKSFHSSKSMAPATTSHLQWRRALLDHQHCRGRCTVTRSFMPCPPTPVLPVTTSHRLTPPSTSVPTARLCPRFRMIFRVMTIERTIPLYERTGKDGWHCDAICGGQHSPRSSPWLAKGLLFTYGCICIAVLPSALLPPASRHQLS